MPAAKGAEYPKALRPPDFKPEPLLVKGPDGMHTEDFTKGRYAQVIVNDEEEEKAVLAAWNKGKAPAQPSLKV